MERSEMRTISEWRDESTYETPNVRFQKIAKKIPAYKNRQGWSSTPLRLTYGPGSN